MQRFFKKLFSKYKTENKINILHEIPPAKRLTCLGFGYNFMCETCDGRMLELIFQSDTKMWGILDRIEAVNIFPANWKYEHIAVSCGFFKSLADARKRAGKVKFRKD